MTRLSRYFALILLPALSASCAPSSPFYLESSVPAGVTINAKSPEKFVASANSKRLAVVLSDNVARAEKYLAGVAEQLSVVNPFATDDADPAYFKLELTKILEKRFAAVTYSESLSSARPKSDIQMIIDYRTKLGWYSGTVTRAQLAGILLDSKGAEIARASGKGETIVPFPAATLRYQHTVDQALGGFSEELDKVLR